MLHKSRRTGGTTFGSEVKSESIAIRLREVKEVNGRSERTLRADQDAHCKVALLSYQCRGISEMKPVQTLIEEEKWKNGWSWLRNVMTCYVLYDDLDNGLKVSEEKRWGGGGGKNM